MLSLSLLLSHLQKCNITAALLSLLHLLLRRFLGCLSRGGAKGDEKWDFKKYGAEKHSDSSPILLSKIICPF